MVRRFGLQFCFGQMDRLTELSRIFQNEAVAFQESPEPPLARSVPLWRFTSRVGGGCFFVSRCAHLMKIALLFLLLTSAQFIAAAEDTRMPPLKAIEQFGSVSITDGSSFFTFSKDGTFRSGPLGSSGREFEGHWTASDTIFTVIAKLGWKNGASTGKDYRRIIFVIYDVQKRPPEPKLGLMLHPDFFDGYFIIDELVKIPRPADPDSK